MLSPFDLPEGAVLLVTDELPSPADFILHQILAEHIKSKKGAAKNIVLSVSEDIAKWKSLAAKVNINLMQHQDSGSFLFFDVPDIVQPPSIQTETPGIAPFRALVDHVLSSLSDSENNCPLVILDDITTLSWIGFSTLSVMRFARALRAACLNANATLVIRHHNLTGNGLDDLFRDLLQLCSYHVDVRPLMSGRSGSVSGEIAIHLGPSTAPGKVKIIPRSAAIQYRLKDDGATFFHRGTEGGVL